MNNQSLRVMKDERSPAALAAELELVRACVEQRCVLVVLSKT